MLNGLDLFSGVGGISVALSEWVRPIAYCENDEHAQGILLSRIASGELVNAPIWDDVRTLTGLRLGSIDVDIIYGGFPCQDTSLAGDGAGLEGERSKLFFEIVRLAKEIKPTFIFIENAPGLRTRGLSRVIQELSLAGYVGRALTLSAEEVGAPHGRNRIFILAADPKRMQLWLKSGRGEGASGQGAAQPRPDGAAGRVAEAAHADCKGELQQGRTVRALRGWAVHGPGQVGDGASNDPISLLDDGVPATLGDQRALGNAVVPAQAREAFMRLMGINRNE